MKRQQRSTNRRVSVQTHPGSSNLLTKMNFVYMSATWKSPEILTALGYEPLDATQLTNLWKKVINSSDLREVIRNFVSNYAQRRDNYEEVVRYKNSEGNIVRIRCKASGDGNSGQPREVRETYSILEQSKLTKKIGYNGLYPVYSANSIGDMEVNHAGQDIEQLKRELSTVRNELNCFKTEVEMLNKVVSVDLQGFMRAISGYATILRDNCNQIPNEEAQGLIDNILNHSRKVSQMLDSMQVFSKVGLSVVDISEINMRSLVRAVIEKELEGNVKKINLMIVGSILPALGEPEMIKQVWTNLIANAVKYTRQKAEATVEISSYKENNFVVYAVKDNGVGFDMQYSHKLFTLFNRLHHYHEFEGAGMGLALVKRILDRNNGKIWAESKPGKGACFYFRLPAI